MLTLALWIDEVVPMDWVGNPIYTMYFRTGQILPKSAPEDKGTLLLGCGFKLFLPTCTVTPPCLFPSKEK